MLTFDKIFSSIYKRLFHFEFLLYNYFIEYRSHLKKKIVFHYITTYDHILYLLYLQGFAF